jgi:glutathionyl-hydroquinone reductase
MGWIPNRETPNLTIRVYKTGFATTQEAYEENVIPLFKSLDRLEKILEKQRYLIGDTATEAGKFRCKIMLIL